MSGAPKISGAEFEVMKIVWREGSVTANSIADELSPRENWSPKTVKTLIARLVKKGALSFKADGKTYIYSAAAKKEDCVAEEAESFLNRVFDGALSPMLAHFAKSKPLSKEDITALKQLLNEER
jgi:BlaI family penicillinase repressor